MLVKLCSEKIKCVCCRKVIPLSKIFMLSKEIEIVDGLQEIAIRHICGYCHMYTTALRKTVAEDNIERVIQVLTQNIV